jgi:hypothetical protein
MELAAGMSQRETGLDRLAALLAGLDPDHVRARDRLEREIGAQLASFLVSALSSHPFL